jgi:glucose-6-phosphate isomerase
MREVIGPYQQNLEAALSQMEKQRIVPRIWEHDYNVWSPDPREISNRLGWLEVAQQIRAEVSNLDSFVNQVRADGFTHALLLGMGGSSLAPEVFRKTFDVSEGYLELTVLDSTVPGEVLQHTTSTDLRHTLIIVSTKSGGTIETLSFFKYFYNLLLAQVGESNAGEHFVAITDPGSKLVEIAQEFQFRELFLNESTIGGRYSALSYFGLVPAALIGVDLALLLERANQAADACRGEATIWENPAARLGALLGELQKVGRDKLTLVLSPSILSFGDWIEQLLAESTGKDGKGILPVVGEPLGRSHDYAGDRIFVSIQLEGEPFGNQLQGELLEAGHPFFFMHLEDRYDLGGQFFIWELATAIAGHRMGINPFNQPNVEAAKDLARQVIASYQEQGVLELDSPSPMEAEKLRDFLGYANLDEPNSSSPRSYLALQAYLQASERIDRDLEQLRTQIRGKTRMATTSGYGPRYLHSTGQLHKGDAGNGLFIQLTAANDREVAIPDRAGADDSTVGFGLLNDAQAMGDRQALRRGGRQVIRFDLGSNLEAGLGRLIEIVDGL